MKNLRENPPADIGGVKVVTRKDYSNGSVVDCATGETSTMELSGSNVLRFELADGTSVIVRPSGTEPKIKVCLLYTSDELPAPRYSGSMPRPVRSSRSFWWRGGL